MEGGWNWLRIMSKGGLWYEQCWALGSATIVLVNMPVCPITKALCFYFVLLENFFNFIRVSQSKTL
jgi:hypothetical protein